MKKIKCMGCGKEINVKKNKNSNRLIYFTSVDGVVFFIGSKLSCRCFKCNKEVLDEGH